MNLRQCQTIKAKMAFTMKVPGTKGRPVSVKCGDLFWITSATYTNETQVKIDRKGKGTIGHGYQMDNETLIKLFEVVE